MAKWGQHGPIAQRTHRPPRPDETFRLEPYLAAVCIFAKEGKLEFFTSAEIRMEAVRQKNRGEGDLGLNLLANVPMEYVPCPAERSITIAVRTGVLALPKKSRCNFSSQSQTPDFLQIKKATGGAHLDDLYHLWTAEKSALDAFLTMDQAFWKTVKQRAAISAVRRNRNTGA